MELTKEQQKQSAWIQHRLGKSARHADYIAKLLKPHNTMQHAFANAVRTASKASNALRLR